MLNLFKVKLSDFNLTRFPSSYASDITDPCPVKDWRACSIYFFKIQKGMDGVGGVVTWLVTTPGTDQSMPALGENSSRMLWLVKEKLLFLSPKLSSQNSIRTIQLHEYLSLHVDSKECLWACTYGFKRFSGLQSSLGITNGNRSHNKLLELIWTI